MSLIKVAIRDDQNTDALNKYTVIATRASHANYKIYTLNSNTLLSFFEVISFIFSGQPYYIFSYELNNRVDFHFESLALFYKNILAVVEQTIANKQIVSLIVDTTDFQLQNILQIKLLHGYCFTFFRLNPGVKLVGSEISFSHGLSNLQFYYNKLKADDHPVEIYNTQNNHKIIYTMEDPAPIIEALRELKNRYYAVFPMDTISVLGSAFGHYLQNTGWEINHKDSEYLGVTRKDIVTLDREYTITKDSITFEHITPLNEINIFNDALSGRDKFHIKIPFNTPSDLYVLARSCFELGDFNVVISIDGGMVNTHVTFFNYQIILKLLDTLKSRLRSTDAEFTIIEYSSVETLLNTDNHIETFYLLRHIYGDKFAFYKNVLAGEFIVYDTAIPLNELPQRLETCAFPSVDIPDENGVEPITTEKYSDLSPSRRALLIPFKNTYYLLNSLLAYIEKEIWENRTLPRNPLTRELLSINDLANIYREFNRLLGVQRWNPTYIYESELCVCRDDEWIRVYLEYENEEYTVVWLPVLPPDNLIYPPEKIIELIREIHRLGLLISPYFDIKYSINHTLVLNICVDFMMAIDSKHIWTDALHTRVEIYNEFCRTLSVYL